MEAGFTPPRERLAYPLSQIGEVAFPRIYPEPVGLVVRALELYRSASVLAVCLRTRSRSPSWSAEAARNAASVGRRSVLRKLGAAAHPERGAAEQGARPLVKRA